VSAPGDAEEYEPRPRPQRRPVRRYQADDGGLSTLIPYRNPKALAGYYLGVLALIPVLGLLLAIAAILFGILGLHYRTAHPEAKGTAHAIIGIVLGVVSLFFCHPLYAILYWFGVR
jgi:uncharacterized membrane protein HdeD (DUF308 family)